MADHHALDLAAQNTFHHRAGMTGQTGSGGIRARVDHRGDMHTRVAQVRGGAQHVVRSPEDHRRLSGGHREPVEVGPHRPGHHHARTVVARQRHGPFRRARRQHGAARDDAPEGLLQPRARRMPLQGAIGALIVDAGHHGPRHHPHVRHRREARRNLGRPARAGLAADPGAFGIQPSARQEVLVGEDHVGPGLRRRPRRHKPRRPGSDHQQIAEGEGLVEAQVRDLLRQLSEPRRTPDHWFEHALPDPRRAHEGLVVEPRPEERGQPVVDLHHVKSDGRPGVLAARVEPLAQFHRRRPRVRLLPRAPAKRDQRVRLLASRRQDAARAVVLERPRHGTQTVRQQGGGQRVALHARVTVPVEPEAKLPVAVDQTAFRQSHRDTSATAKTSWVRVSRSTTSQAEQPFS